jgi:hypothetical protein
MQRIEFKETNADGNYATHGYFRYFGKLPPAVIHFIIKKGTECATSGPIVDVMCGCGTSLVESMIIGHPSIGVDVNPIATLVSKVKTTILDEKQLWDTLNYITEDRPSVSDDELRSVIPRFRNVDYWFLPKVQLELAELKRTILTIEDVEQRDFFMVAFLSIIRRVSNSSPRPGRLFHIDHAEQPRVKKVFIDKASGMIKKIKELRWLARCTDVKAATFVIFHPPYFALYKYSSDVLRFELEWFGANRRSIAASEIEDGFKTTDIGRYKVYIQDVTEVLAQAERILKPDHKVCLVVNNSTFRNERLPVVEDVCAEAGRRVPRLKMSECLERGVRYQQASYHRSAREDKVTSLDYLVFFQKHI